jgi:hypothetical protein
MHDSIDFFLVLKLFSFLALCIALGIAVFLPILQMCTVLFCLSAK